jgi:glycolate oxidase iron-sulfur subunit
MRESSLCCGSAGIYNLTQPEMSARLRQRKVDCILEVDPQIVATANPGCALQLNVGIEQNGRTIGVKHIVELLDESYAASA